MNKKLGMVREVFPKLFGDKAYPMVTECMVQAAKRDAQADKDVVKLMASFERAPCGHQGNLRSADDCLRDCFAEPRYCLAGRSGWSMKLAYYFPHVLVLMWDFANVLVLRAPTQDAKASVETQMEGKRGHADDMERRLTREALAEEKRERAVRNAERTKKIAYNMRYHHKPIAKGPNPRSMLKPMTQADRAKKRSTRSPFMQFGGATQEGADPFDDPSFISRSKLRRKRQRYDESIEKIIQRQADESSAPNSTNQNDTSASAPSIPDESSTAPTPKIRKRRKPKTASTTNGDDQSHKFREAEFEHDAKVESQAASS